MPEEFREWLKSERKKRKLGPGTLGKKIKMDAEFIKMIESGRLSVSYYTVKRISDALEIDFDMLLCLAGIVPDDIVDILTRHPIEAPKLLREFDKSKKE